MSTTEPTPTSLSEADQKTEAELKVIHEELRKHDVCPEALTVVLLDPQEMVFGEVFDHENYVGYEERHSSIFQVGSFITIKNPKRFTRMVYLDARTRESSISVSFADFDFVSSGIIEVKPVGAFFLDWLDYASQLAYCRAYLRFLEGRIKARAARAGIVMPDEKPTTIQNLLK